MNGISVKRTVAVLVGLCALAAGIALLFSRHGGHASAATAKRNFCDSLSSLSSTVRKFDGLNPRSTTNEQIQQAAKNVDNAWNNADHAARDWGRRSGNATAQAYRNLGQAVAALPANATIAQDMQKLAAFPRAYRQTFDGSGCTPA